ncbi:Zeaxanthin epoxidase-like protein [Lachnellula arida]|uniref:Zeaxanthin epoxidase-like protein n=1 Tax=Lachnellula arida TaxID=1316785 RepID=A0A8T9BE72_9HELO|nr:Zeaxanthin epoxidase-like protein [Lachnellula arida]
MSYSRVLIIGAGVGGLALAQGLRKGQIDFAVFEKDPLLDSRLQGYRLKIFGEFQTKLRDLLTDEAWSEFEATCAETHLGETTLNATDGRIIGSRKGYLPEGMPLPYTIDRGMLRRSLMKGIEDSVQFDKRFLKYELNDQGVKVTLEDGSIEQGTLLVGADGARSLVRKQLLPDHRPLDTKGCCIYGKSILTPELLARFPVKHRKWMTVIVDKTPILQSIISGEEPLALVSEPVRFANRISTCDLPEDYIHWGLMFPENTSGLKDEELEKALRSRAVDLSLQLTSEWDPSVRSLIELQDQSLTMGMRMYNVGPNIPAWTSSANITLMGDAIHVMAPSGGVGAVAALHDASVLAQIIGDEGITEASIGYFEGSMRQFAKVCIMRSFVAGKKMLNMPSFEDCHQVDW